MAAAVFIKRVYRYINRSLNGLQIISAASANTHFFTSNLKFWLQLTFLNFNAEITLDLHKWLLKFSIILTYSYYILQKKNNHCVIFFDLFGICFFGIHSCTTSYTLLTNFLFNKRKTISCLYAELPKIPQY